ncbi:biotin synthase [Desulfitispora alkaliphila]|uniref:biotin synthase BioB n=1 Tax=Desulfitispora alkaliphila TaxID=622674 RepID=UPI003D1CE347
MKEYIANIERKILAGQQIDFSDAIKLSALEKKEDIDQLCNSANNIREFYWGNRVDLCSIMNAKSGRCSEDCKFCAQSSRYNTGVETFDLVSIEAAIELAKENQAEGVNRFSLVTSGKEIRESDFQKVLEIYNLLQREVRMDLCASLGIIGYNKLLKLRKAGITMYHHNLETSREYYPKICTTHSYEERIDTIKAVQKAGMAVCSGGIIGLGESMADRVKLAFQLRELEVRSIPINILNPIKGTPLENTEVVSESEILKTFALFRFINPRAAIRLAGGRDLIANHGKVCFKAGANATITGNYLTTSGNKIRDDKKMIKELGLSLD